MRGCIPIVLLGWVAWAAAALAQGQASGPPMPANLPAPFTPPPRPGEPVAGPQQTSGVPREGGRMLLSLQQDLDRDTREWEKVKAEQAAAQDAKEAERLQKQVDLLQKQIDRLHEMILLLKDELQKQTAVLEGRSRQAARRDQDLAGAVDDLREQADAERRWGPRLPAHLRELFLPSETNHSPLSFYGVLVGNYRKFEATPGAGEFEFQEFDTYFLLQLNRWILLETELEFGTGGVEIGQAQADFIVSDCLTAVAGRFRV